VLLCNYTDVYYNEKITSRLSFMPATATRIEFERFLLLEGDVIITKDSESWNDIGVPACVDESLSDVVCGYHLCLLRPKKDILNGLYLLRALQSVGVREQLWMAARGVTRFGLGLDGIKSLEFPLPPLPAQKAIANFLDRKTAAIDALIEKKEKLLELLAEKRSALINQAVTKGLDPNVPMKDSGIPWLGEIPEHWESKPSKYVLDFVTSGSRGWSEYFSDFGSIFLQSGNLVGNLKVDFDNVQRVEPPQNAEGARTRVRVGDVLVCITGGLTGNVGIVEGVPEVTFVNQHLGLLRPVKNEIDSKFLALQLASLVGQLHFQMVQYGGTKKGLSLTDLKNVGLAVPPITEQFSIVEAVENQLARISMARDKSESQISLLREYRQSLITAAVTGQLEIPTEEYE